MSKDIIYICEGFCTVLDEDGASLSDWEWQQEAYQDTEPFHDDFEDLIEPEWTEIQAEKAAKLAESDWKASGVSDHCTEYI